MISNARPSRTDDGISEGPEPLARDPLKITPGVDAVDFPVGLTQQEFQPVPCRGGPSGMAAERKPDARRDDGPQSIWDNVPDVAPASVLSSSPSCVIHRQSAT